MHAVRDAFLEALRQAASRLDRVLELWPGNPARDDLSFARDVMLSRRNELSHSTFPLYVNEAQTCSDMLDQIERQAAAFVDQDFRKEVSFSLEPLRLVVRKYARPTEQGLRFPSDEGASSSPRLTIRRS